MPLYALIFAAVALGVVVGGVGSWLGQGARWAAGSGP
jgi:phosphotransferase system  glucose/maltose/N-acetylglucosamine-specific IIC component